MENSDSTSTQAIDKEEVIINELIKLLNGGNAHASFEEAIKSLPFSILGTKVDQLPYTIWQLIEHIRITQWDILEFSKSPSHESPEWPDEYWPEHLKPIDETEWKGSLQQIQNDKQEFIELLKNRSNNIYESFPYGSGQNLIREGMLIADHTSYHIGQIILIRKLLGDWKN